MKYIGIENIVDEYNYRSIVFHIADGIDLDDFYEKVLRPANIGHGYRYATVQENRLFYIENCDLQDVDLRRFVRDLEYLISEGFSILQINMVNGRYCIVDPIGHE